MKFWFLHRGVFDSLLHLPGLAWNSLVLSWAGNRSESTTRFPGSMERHLTLPRWGGNCFGHRVLPCWYLLQYDHRMVLLLSVCVMAESITLLSLSREYECNSSGVPGVYTRRCDKVLLVQESAAYIAKYWREWRYGVAPSTLSSARMDCCVSVHDEGRSVGWKGKGIDEQLFYLKVTEKLRNLKNVQ